MNPFLGGCPNSEASTKIYDGVGLCTAQNQITRLIAEPSFDASPESTFPPMPPLQDLESKDWEPTLTAQTENELTQAALLLTSAQTDRPWFFWGFPGNARGIVDFPLFPLSFLKQACSCKNFLLCFPFSFLFVLACFFPIQSCPYSIFQVYPVMNRSFPFPRLLDA